MLLTEGASLSARQTLYGLGHQYQIDVFDPDPLCQGRFSSYVRRWIRSPSFSEQPERYLQTLMSLIAQEQYDVVLPTHEQVYLLSRFQALISPRVGLAVPSFAALQQLQNKIAFRRLLDQLQLPQPGSEIIRGIDDWQAPRQYPFFLKLAHSTAGRGVSSAAS